MTTLDPLTKSPTLIKFKTGKGSFAAARIERVEVERETELSVWINGYRRAKANDFDILHDSWEAAHAYLTERAVSRVVGARRTLELANAFAGNVKGMKKPAA